MIDKVISELDFAIKLMTVPPKGNRGNPGEQYQSVDNELSTKDTKEISRLMRINHTGEICAQALYRGQLFFNSDSYIKTKLKQASLEEIDHLNWCDQRIKELKGQTSQLNPLFYFGSFALGAIASKIDTRFNLGFLEETEKQVSAHLNNHLEKIPQKDKKTHAILKQMKYDEQCHQKTANALGAKKLPSFFKKIMGLSSKIMTKTTYWI